MDVVLLILILDAARRTDQLRPDHQIVGNRVTDTDDAIVSESKSPGTCARRTRELPCCGSTKLSKLGEDVTETLEVIPRQWKVIQTVREKFSC